MDDDFSEYPRRGIHSSCDPLLVDVWIAGRREWFARQQAEMEAIFLRAQSDPELRQRLDKPMG